MFGQTPQPAATVQPPNQPTPPAEVYGVFCSAINELSVQKLSNMVALVTQARPQPKCLHILFQSSGGTLVDSVYLYGFLKSCPIDITIYNCGNVGSGGAIAFLGAKRRVTSKLATFMLHRPHCAPQAATVDRLNSVVSLLNIDDARLETILKAHLKIPDADWASLRNNEFSFTGEEAVKNGMADEIGEFSPPKGQSLLSLTL
jgi:ATP-dependent Clp protease, protease subunit